MRFVHNSSYHRVVQIGVDRLSHDHGEPRAFNSKLKLNNMTGHDSDMSILSHVWGAFVTCTE